MKNFQHIHNVLVNCGYPESHESKWFIQIEERDGCMIIPHWYDCGTKERAKKAAKSLLNKTDVYEVVVFSPDRNPVTFYGNFKEYSERIWRYYYG